MARPSKKTLELRSKILEIEAYKRDYCIYTSFEIITEHQDRFNIPYLFATLCRMRDEKDDHGFILKSYQGLVKRYTSYEVIVGIDTSKTIYTPITERSEDYTPNRYFNDNICYEEIKKINKELADKYLLNFITNKRINKIENFQEKNYFVFNEIENTLLDTILKKTLSPKRYDYYINEYRTNTRLDLLLESGVFLTDPLQKDEEDKILKELKKYGYRVDKTIIKRVPTISDVCDIVDNKKNKNVHIELDLTKPLDEILKYVTMLKNDFDRKPDNFKNAYELLGEKQEVFNCELKDCNIYKDTKSPKPISGRLADVLFIYDCKKVNELLGADILTNEYITGEINRYWQEVKNISPDGFHSLEEYYAIAKEYIDEQKYKDYLTGVKHTL